ncbi:hypothetical protein Goklo_015061 [Gossypium klotzschianum]|uniref:Uncharacterized protein n=1 Tax=Gossypium klotzschianum TaxID=34286 RepID=A0A7J8U9S5_9ROSI|nr:hypothetical protein [Gossypium klotzschianum]
MAARKQLSIRQAPNILVVQLKEWLLDCYGRDLRESLVGRLIGLSHSKKFWFFQASCAKLARCVKLFLLHISLVGWYKLHLLHSVNSIILV